MKRAVVPKSATRVQKSNLDFPCMSSTHSAIFGKVRLVWGLTFLILVGVNSLRLWKPHAERLQDWGQRRAATTNDNLAYQLSRGQGFSIDFNDNDWNQDRGITSEELKTLDNWAIYTQGPTTRSPPLFPLAQVISQGAGNWRNRVTLAVQMLLNASALATLIVFSASQLGTRWLIPLSLLFVALDPLLFWNSQRFVVNELSIGIVALLVVSAGVATVRGTVWAWAVVGLWLALQVLNEGQSLLWLAWILVFWPVMLVSWAISGRSLRRFLWPSLAVVTVVLLVCGPWWVRNASLTDACGAFGYDLPIQLTGGYCDDVIANQGRLFFPAIRNIEGSINSGKRYRELDQPHREQAMADLANKQTFGWLGRHLSKLPPLVQWKLLDHLNLTNRSIPMVIFNASMIVLALVGCWLSRAPVGFWITMVLLISATTNAVTWSDGGFSSAPLRPLMAVAASYAIVRALRIGRAGMLTPKSADSTSRV